MGVLFVILGIFAMAGGIFGKDFHVADIISLRPYKDKMPTWLGRLVCIVVGVFFIAVGIKFLLDAR